MVILRRRRALAEALDLAFAGDPAELHRDIWANAWARIEPDRGPILRPKTAQFRNPEHGRLQPCRPMLRGVRMVLAHW